MSPAPHSFRVAVPGLRTVNPLNNRTGWKTVWRRSKQQKRSVTFALFGHKLPALPATITLTRMGPGIMDSDGLAASFKATRDSVAAAYGVDDGSPLYEWRYCQRRAKAYEVWIDIQASACADPLQGVG